MTPEEKKRAAELRDALEGASDEALDRFLAAHALGTIAGHLIAQMTPEGRFGFFAAMRELYPEARDGGGGS